MKTMQTGLLAPILATLSVLCVAGSVGAAEDAGTRSVFAHGAGNRALALGGAYAAVADDASASLWNPGGLGFIGRRQLQGTRTTFYGLGMSEEYVGVVLPHWRLGTAALTFRHFGVDGIEGRDERNVVTDDGLSDSESEIALSYGRRIGRTWGVGGSLKLRRQSLAGLSAGGIGADLGVVMRPGPALGRTEPWAENITLGFAVQNLLQPSLRLDQETVNDPTAVRLGAAYRHLFGNGRVVMAAADLERVPDMGLRLHAGVEVIIHSLLALRTGVRGGGVLTAGTGLAWRDFSLDYAYENNDLGSLHRVGLSLAFGPSTEESRLTAQRAEEAALQARLGETFARRQAERTAQLLAEAAKTAEQGRHDDALDILETAATLDPGRADIASLRAGYLLAKARQQETRGELTEAALTYDLALMADTENREAAEGAKRCRIESDRQARRSAEIRAQFSAALDAFSTGDLLAARRGFAAIVEADSSDQDAAAMLERTGRAIERRSGDLLQQARSFARSQLFAQAQTAIAEARTLTPGAPGIGEAEALLARARSKAAVPTPSPKTTSRNRGPAGPAAPPPLSPQRRREVEELYRRGIAAMDAGRSDDALRYWELVHSADPRHQQVREYLKREYLLRGMDNFASGKLDEAVTWWEKAIAIDPTDEKAKGYLTRARQQLVRSRQILESDDR